MDELQAWEAVNAARDEMVWKAFSVAKEVAVMKSRGGMPTKGDLAWLYELVDDFSAAEATYEAAEKARKEATAALADAARKIAF